MNCQMMVHKLWKNYIVWITMLSDDDDDKDFIIKYRRVLRDNFFRMSQH